MPRFAAAAAMMPMPPRFAMLPCYAATLRHFVFRRRHAAMPLTLLPMLLTL